MQTGTGGDLPEADAASEPVVTYTFNTQTLQLGLATANKQDSAVPSPRIEARTGHDTDAIARFFAERQQGWIHGTQPPTTIFKYNKRATSVGDDSGAMYGSEQKMFVPAGKLGPVEHASLRKPAQRVAAGERESESEITKRQEEPNGGFSGYYSMPQLAINAPLSFRKGDKRKLLNEIPNHCYHNDGSLNGISYIFGGLAASKYNDFSHLNIPTDTDPAKISVYFPYELPPFVSREIITSPYMVQLPHLVQFNASRNTITYLDSESTLGVPWRLCGASSCAISRRHIFFFGGFELETESTEYVVAVDRWVVHKKLVMNDCGYIFDTLTLKFTKIRFDRKNRSDLLRGRLGCGITANIYEPAESELDLPVRIPLPPVFTDSSSDTDVLTHSTSPETPRTPTIRVPVPLSSGLSLVERKDVLAHTPTPTTGLKMGSLIGKTTKIFHRHHQHNISGAPSPSLQNSLLNSHLTNTYSREMSRMRSNSNTNTSRPTSPILKQLSSQTNKITLVPTVTGEKSAKTEPDVKFVPAATDSVDLLKHKNGPQLLRTNTGSLRGDSVLDSSSIASADTIPSANILFDDSVIKSGIVSVSVFVFGGFQCVLEEGIGKFRATNDLLKIDIGSKDNRQSVHFMDEALIYAYSEDGGDTSPGKTTVHRDNWPEPRGYFAFSLVDVQRSYVDHCKWDLYEGPLSDDQLNRVRSQTSENMSSTASFPSKGGTNGSIQRKVKSPQDYYSGKAFMVQGGIDEHNHAYSDLHLFVFDSGRWTTLSTYVHEYFSADEDSPIPKCKETENPFPPLIEAELRACHHTALYYKNEDRDYLIFVGGITSDLLGGASGNKFDVAEYAKFLLVADNPYLLRMMVLNLQTQTWQFIRYYHGEACSTGKSFGQMVAERPWWKNTRICFAGGSIYMNEKSVNISHGLAFPAPESDGKREEIQDDLPLGYALWGAHVLFTFPSL